ncbi:ciliogenesis and planar polarity effector 1 isoform X1 [Anarrhichthys ocellatus]|uniref:ciliogenesis and planar polarity effector 1 isoform X1 n=1 Tax=Anarrhichthys ocellatus TaxID=433405 RepID=UPI0012EE429F|nr:ciliogenesis and planar polarity effector 1 isoform X1 [Anarrhichthys ocellatus]XP_031711729.1 ciliogenesis and planar polarity effector 1 isoform X1 [Anarrhichthys ocellatus]
MDLKLEVVLSSSIKRKKPWPRFCWLGKEKESVFLLDDRRISEINMMSGRTKKRTPKLHPLLNSVVTMASSHNGMWLCGLLVSGELFLWNRDKDLLKTAAAVPQVVQVITDVQGNAMRLSLQVSDDGMRVFLVAITGEVFLWECVDVRDLTGVRDGAVKGHWAHIQPLEDSILPSSQDKEASQHTIFIKTEVMGDACLSAFVFTSEKKLIITCLKIQWEEGPVRVGSVGYSIQWATKTYPMSCLAPPCKPVKSRGALVPAFSPDGCLLAIVLNQRQPKATQVLFVSTQNFVSTSSGLGGCGSKKLEIPSKYIRSYWVGSVSWSPGGLFLACVLKRGSLLILTRLGGLITLTSVGCNVDFGPAHFLPLHPLVTYRAPVSAGKGEASRSSSSLSVRDVLRQRYSVTWHPRLLYFIVSDGYMATVMRVLDRPSPALMLKTLLKDTSADLEKASRILDKSQIHVRAWLESLSCLNLDSSLVTRGPNTADSVVSAATDGSTLPLFLQDQGTLGGTKDLLGKVQTFFEDDSDVDGPPAGSHVEDGGRLEFASMFDTLHALDTQTDAGLVTSPDYENDSGETERKTPAIHRELGKIQTKLLTAWAIGMSLGNAVEDRTRLLKHTLYCVVRFAALLHLLPSSVNTGRKNILASTRLLHLLKALLSFLPWDSTHSDGPCCLGLVVELSRRLIRLLLTPLPESHQTGHCQLSSHSLSSVLLILQLVSDSLDDTYSLQQRTVWSSAETESLARPPQLWPSDAHYVPLLQNEKEEKSHSLHQARPVPQRPSSRLLRVWQWVYKITQQYMDDLKSFKGCEGWEEEQQQLSVIMSQIQTALQATGERLEEGPALLSYPGERLFLCGSYPKSADIWRSQICEESNENCDRSVFKETRLCLALLYGLLSQYRLRESQELGDHMARLILHRAGHQKDNVTCITADSFPCPWLPMDLHSDAACAVVQTLGRFMASYFTNQPLYILPPHHVAILPPLHLPHAPSVGRLVPLCQEEVSRAVRQQQLSEVWTVDYAQDLLLLGGLLPETVWLAYHLGDWKTAASLSLAYTNYCTDHFDFTRLRRRELHLPTALEPESIFEVELECLLGNKSDFQERRDKDGDKSFTDPAEGEDWDLLQVSIQEILKASVMAGVNVMSSPLSSLLDTVKDLCSCLPILVPNGLYLPSPPLYCPQPSPNTQDPIGTIGQFAEVASRHKVSGVLQRLLLLLRSARCCHPAAQWYISHLRRARHILHKIKKKYAYPSAAEEERAFPEGLMKFVSRRGFFRRGPNKDGHLDADTIQTIICFRELCALCWMLHVRDQLSISCRTYQAARQHGRDEQIPGGSEVRSTCVDALRWARRFLPFSCFLNAEEILQDILLSLVSELPPLSLVADTLVRAFPEEEESVRVPLREKYHTLLQKLRGCNVLEGEKEDVNELMMIVIQDKFRQRRKHLGRLMRHLAPLELRLWENEEEQDDRGSKHGMAMLRQLSLGTSLSTSTLTDCGFPSLYSDGDTVDNTYEAVSPEMHSRATTRGKKVKVRDREHAKKTAVKIESVIQEEGQPGDAKENEQPPLPVVGTWEFELEDEEYLNFLELFLSYVLEKDIADGSDSGGDLPLLKGFSSQLRERELHSLTFDVLTTIHRRQRDGHQPARKHLGNEPPVFRAGCCYKPVKQGATPDLQTSSVWSEAPVSRTSLSVTSLPGLRTGRQKGLFGLRQQRPLGQRMKGGLFCSETSPSRSAFPAGQPSENLIFGSSTSVEAVIELQQGLDPKLEAQFPELGRLLEWMVRWADRRVLLGHHGKKKKERGGGVGGTADEGVVIRVKASAPAVLTSLSLLERRYTALLGTDRYSAHIQVPETQWTVAPVLQPEADQQLERESSVDTGYPGSANTPIIGLDCNLQQGELSTGSHTDEPEEQASHRTPFSNDQDQLTSDAQQGSQQPSHEDLDVTPEKEGKRSDSEGLEVSSSVSNGNISENICTPETSLKLADLDSSESAEDMSSSTSLHSHAGSLQAPPEPEPQAPPTVQPEAEVHADPFGSIGTLLTDTHVAPPNLQPQSSTAAATAAASTTPSQPLSNQTPPTQQRLGEDLFRLVQNINYMSLMEVLGASFSNLQLAQQSSSLAQSDMNMSHPNVPSSYAPKFIPQPHPLPAQTTIPLPPQTCLPNSRYDNPQSSRAPACMFAEQPAFQSTGKTSPTSSQHHTTRNLPSSANGAGASYQEMQPLSLQVVSPEIHCSENKRLITPSQGLLATTHSSHAAHTAPVLLPSNISRQSDPAPQVLGLKLLQLHCPPSPQQSGPQHPQSPQTLPTANPATIESHHDNLRYNDQSSSVPKRQPSFYPPHDPTPRHSQAKSRTSERSRVQGFSLLPPALPAHTPEPMQGLRLLHLQPVPHSNTTFPKLPLPPSSRFTPNIAVPMGEAPMIKLLHMDAGPQMMFHKAAPSAQMTRLMSVEELSSSVVGRENAEKAQLQLLKVDPATESTRRATTSPSSISSKRQQRREEKAKRTRTTEVTFRPNESIIPTQEPTNEPVHDEPAAAEEITPGQDVANFAQFGSFDSLLSGQRLLDRSISTSAELHAFASTCKRPPECHDAFTNTDPACPPTLVDKAVCASVTASSPKPQSSGNQQFCSEGLVRDTEESPQEQEKNLGLDGRQFISVLDLEDKALHHDLPSYLSPGAQDVPSIRPSSPTSAQLHVLAISVVRSDAAADPQAFVAIQEDLDWRSHTDIPEESPSLSHIEGVWDPERIVQQEMVELSDSKICQAIKTQSVGPHGASSTPPTVWFSSRLSELDTQLAALQNIADNLEIDFCNSRMLVNTIEKLTPVLAPDVKTTTAVKKTVRLSVPREAWLPRLDTLTEPNAFEEEEENQEEESVLHNDSWASEGKPSFRYSTSSYSHNAGPSYLHTPPKMKNQLTEASGISPVWADENLGQTGLSDTAEILDELVREGYLSPTDLDLSNSQTANRSSRLDQQQSGWMSQKRVLPEDERRELRIWMRRKQRERLAVYQKHRESLREREHKPFSTSGTVKSTNKNQATVWRTREEKEKFMLLEQYNQRTREAYSLASDFLTSRPTLRTSPVVLTTRPTSAPPSGSTHSVSANDKIRLKSGQAQPHLRPWTAEMQGQPSEDHRRRLGLHRPVTSLPRDRLSQVTRRGMLTHTKSHSTLHTASQSEERHVAQQRVTGLNKGPSRGTVVGRGILRDQARMEEREDVNRREPTSELNRLLEPEESYIDLAGLVDEQDDGARAGLSAMDWLDNLSESTGSSVSKIDWEAIERLVAAEDP